MSVEIIKAIELSLEELAILIRADLSKIPGLSPIEHLLLNAERIGCHSETSVDSPGE